MLIDFHTPRRGDLLVGEDNDYTIDSVANISPWDKRENFIEKCMRSSFFCLIVSIDKLAQDIIGIVVCLAESVQFHGF